LPISSIRENKFSNLILSYISKDKLLLRADSAHDAVANRVELSRHDDVDYIIKWNPRKQDPDPWKPQAFSKGTVGTPRPGKRVAIFSVLERHSTTGENGKEKELAFRRVMRVTERAIDKKGQQLLLSEIELEGWWTSLSVQDEEVIALYRGHGLCEQYHSGIKTVIQELIYFAGRLITTGRRLRLRFSRHVHGHVEAFRHAYQRLAYG
jgi:hypothetical protein